jgi:hypothetical protein
MGNQFPEGALIPHFFLENQMSQIFIRADLTRQHQSVEAIEALLAHVCYECLQINCAVRPQVWLVCGLPPDFAAVQKVGWYWYDSNSVVIKGHDGLVGPFVSKIHAGLDALSHFHLGNKDYLNLSQKQYDQLIELEEGYEALKSSGCCYGIEQMAPFLANRADYDAAEIHPVALVDAGGAVEVVDDDEAQFWSVYLHLKAGGVECVGDFVTKAEAEIAADSLERLFGFSLPLVRESVLS